MKFSTKARYGMRAMLDLALHRDESPISLKDIAGRQQISLPYLEHLMSPLVAAGLVRTGRGPKGGIRLDKAPDQVTLMEIVQALEGSTAPVECVDNPKLCPRSDSCVTREVWDKVQDAVCEVLKSRTLQDLVERYGTKTASREAMYFI